MILIEVNAPPFLQKHKMMASMITILSQRNIINASLSHVFCWFIA